MPIEKRRQRQSRIRFEPGGNSDSSGNGFQSKEVKDHDNEATSADSAISHVQPENNKANPNIHESKNDTIKLGLKKSYCPPIGSSQTQRSGVRGNQNPVRREATNNKFSQDKKRDIARSNNVSFDEDMEYEPVTIMQSSSDGRNESSCLKKYQRREVTSNWLRYEELPLEDEVELGEDYLLGEDFSNVLDLQGNNSSSGHLHLKGEQSWCDMNSTHLGSYGLGALKVADLVSALATIPFHQRLKIPEESLPAQDIYMYKNDAEAHKKTYTFDKEYVTDIAINEAFLANLKLQEADTIGLASAVQDTKHTSDCTKVENINISSKFITLLDDNCLKQTSKEAILTEVSETKQELSKNTTQPGKPISDKETHYNIPKLKPDPLSGLNSNTFNFGLPQRCSKVELAVQPPESLVKQNLKSKLSDKSNFDGVEIKLKDDEHKVNEDNETKVIPDMVETMSKVKEPVILVSKTEIENLEDWLDSVLDD